MRQPPPTLDYAAGKFPPRRPPRRPLRASSQICLALAAAAAIFLLPALFIAFLVQQAPQINPMTIPFFSGLYLSFCAVPTISAIATLRSAPEKRDATAAAIALAITLLCAGIHSLITLNLR